MAGYNRNRSRYDEENRGVFGYEGEGYMRGGGRDIEDRWRNDHGGERDYGGYGDPRWDEEQRYRGAGYGSEAGYRGAGYLGGSYRGASPYWRREIDYGRQSFRGRGPKNYQRSDDRIREDVCERLEQDERVDATEIEVDVQNGIVTLSGSVDDRLSKRRAEDIVESVSGVKEVLNQIRVSHERGETARESPR